jgi:enterochelin esterase family protein
MHTNTNTDFLLPMPSHTFVTKKGTAEVLAFIILSFIFMSCSTKKNKIEFQEIRHIYKSVSPTMAVIQRMSKPRQEIAITDLIEKGRIQGFPLIETDSLYFDYVYVTFIYVDTTHRHEIAFEVFGIYDEHRFHDRKLYRLDSTNVYSRSYMIPNNLCLSYRFILRDTVTGARRIVTDPFNTNQIPTGEVKDYSWSVLDLRSDEPDLYIKSYDTVSQLNTHIVTSNILNNTRDIYIYLPADYGKMDTKYPVIYLFDQFIYLNRIEAPNVLDNLVREKKIEPMVAVFISNPTDTSRDYELPMNSLMRDFMVTELVPQIKNRYSITDKPSETIIGGISYGGLAAAFIAFECDSIFGKVLSQSGSF